MQESRHPGLAAFGPLSDASDPMDRKRPSFLRNTISCHFTRSPHLPPNLHRRTSIRGLRRAPPRDRGRVVPPHPTLFSVSQRHDADTKERIARGVARYHAVRRESGRILPSDLLSIAQGKAGTRGPASPRRGRRRRAGGPHRPTPPSARRVGLGWGLSVHRVRASA